MQTTVTEQKTKTSKEKQEVVQPSYSFIKNPAKRAFFEGKMPTTTARADKETKRRHFEIVKRLRKINFNLFPKTTNIFGLTRKKSATNRVASLEYRLEPLKTKAGERKAPAKPPRTHPARDVGSRSRGSSHEQTHFNSNRQEYTRKRSTINRNPVDRVFNELNARQENENLSGDQIAILENLMKLNIGLIPRPYKKPSERQPDRNLKEETAMFLNSSILAEIANTPPVAHSSATELSNGALCADEEKILHQRI